MRTLTVHTADELVTRWRTGAAQRRALWGEMDERAHAVEICANELEAILLASVELEAAHHGDPE